MFIIALGVLLTQAVHAYVPPSFYIVRMLARKHSSLEEGKFRHKVSVYKKNGDLFRTFLETLALSDSEHATIRLTDEAGTDVAFQTRKLIGPRTGDITRPVSYDLLMIKDGANIYEHFKILGLPLRTESDLYAEKEGSLPYKPEATVALSRYENRVTVVISDAQAKSEASSRSPQLWVEKDSFLPLKAVFPTAPERGIASEPLEFRFSGYQAYKSLLYPRTMQVYRDGKLWVKVETQDVTIGGAPRIEQPKSSPKLDGDVEEFVEAYFKWVR